MAIDKRTAHIIKDKGLAPSAPSTDSTPPAAPGKPFVIERKDDAITIGFTASASADVASYVAYVDASNLPAARSEAQETVIKLRGLSAGNHSVVVQAVDVAGNHSASSPAGIVSKRYPDRGVMVVDDVSGLPAASEFGVGVAQVGGSIAISNGFGYGYIHETGLTDNPTTNKQIIQNALDTTKVCNINKPGEYFIDPGIVLDDYCALILGTGVTLRLAAGKRANMVVTRGYLNTDYNVTSLASVACLCTVTMDHNNLVALGVSAGDYIAINWALPEFYSGVFKVESVNFDTNTLTYKTFRIPSATSAIPGSGGSIKIRKATVMPMILGDGTIDYDSPSQTGSSTSLNLMGNIISHCFNPIISGRFTRSLKYNMLCACTTNLEVLDFTTFGQSDGLHITGPAWFPRVNKITCSNLDNGLAIGSGDYASYLLSEGAIVGAVIDYVMSDNSPVDPVRVWGTSAYSCDVTIDTIDGHTESSGIKLINDSLIFPDSNSWVSNFEVRNFNIKCDNTYIIYCGATKLGRLVISGNQTKVGTGQILIDLQVGSGGFEHIEIKDTLFLGVSGSKLIECLSSFAGSANIKFSNVKATGSWAVNNNSTQNLTIQASNCDFSGLTNTVRGAGATGNHKMHSSSSIHPATAMVKVSGATLEAYGFDIKMATNTLELTNGQFANINGSLSICKGGAWGIL